MKRYDRESKKHISEEEYQGKLKRRKLCKGGKPHDWVEVLPYGVSTNELYNGTTGPYYEAEKAIREFTKQKHDELAALGIFISERWSREVRKERPHICSVCKKHGYFGIVKQAR